MLTTFTLSTKKPQFSSSAETSCQVILLSFQLFDNVVWYIANNGQMLYCIKVQSKNGIANCAFKKINVKIKNRILTPELNI